MEPTKWFVAREGDCAARWYWPESTQCEIANWASGWQWVPMHLFIELSEDRYHWPYSTEAEMTNWLRDHN